MDYSIDWGTDITKVRTNIISNTELTKNKFLVSNYLANIIGKNLDEQAKKELAKKIQNKITIVPNDKFIELTKLIEELKDKNYCVNLLFALIAESLYSIKSNSGEAQRIFDIIVQRSIAMGMAPDASNINDIDTSWIQNDESQDSPHFDYIFALTLRQTSLQNINDFLNFQRKEYNGDFKIFLEICLKEYESLFNPKTVEIVTKWLASSITISNEQAPKNEKELIVFLPRIKRDKNDGATALTADQSAYLMLFLKDVKIILKDNTYQTNEEMAKALQIMTGYKAGQARKMMSTPIEKIDKKELKVLKTIVEKLLSSINKHI